jgi:hypothetical protein
MREPRTLPPVNQGTLEEALAVAEASLRELNPEVRRVLEEQARDLWRHAHQARRDAMYACGRRP